MIQFREVSKVYAFGDNNTSALKNVSFDIAQGEMIALMGPSGSGKSTILNLLGALDYPSTGKILVDQVAIESLSKGDQAIYRGEKVGFVFQNFNLIPVLTAKENVMLPCQLSKKRLAQEESEKRASYLLDRVGLASHEDHMTNRLSGGQMQRVAIARALMNQPKLILADEPTANLDQGTAGQIMKLLQEIIKEGQVTIVIATHDRDVVEYCGRVLKVRDGEIH